MSTELQDFATAADVRRADHRLEDALDAVAEIDTDELPDEIAADVRHAYGKLLKAKGHCEVERTEVSVE